MHMFCLIPLLSIHIRQGMNLAMRNRCQGRELSRRQTCKCQRCLIIVHVLRVLMAAALQKRRWQGKRSCPMPVGGSHTVALKQVCSSEGPSYLKNRSCMFMIWLFHVFVWVRRLLKYPTECECSICVSSNIFNCDLRIQEAFCTPTFAIPFLSALRPFHKVLFSLLKIHASLPCSHSCFYSESSAPVWSYRIFFSIEVLWSYVSKYLTITFHNNCEESVKNHSSTCSGEM